MLRWAFTSVIVLAIAIFFTSKENRQMAKRITIAYWKSVLAAAIFLLAFFTLTYVLQ